MGYLKENIKSKNLITGGAGFIGSHLIKKLLENGQKVICLDNLKTGSETNFSNWKNHSNFNFIDHDVTKNLNINVDKVWHLASPASPAKYKEDPIYTIKTGVLGTLNMLKLARRNNAQFLFASTSEIYGHSVNFPQKESEITFGNTHSSRACYLESKRIAETLCYEYGRLGVDVKIARIFNTYGPNMLMDDGRVICNFISQSILNKPITIYGNGYQTRSFCYIDDLISGLLLLINSNYNQPMNLGNDQEISILDLANLIKIKTGNKLAFKFLENREDDPKRRCPCLKISKTKLNWQPSTNISEGLDLTIDYFKKRISFQNV